MYLALAWLNLAWWSIVWLMSNGALWALCHAYSCDQIKFKLRPVSHYCVIFPTVTMFFSSLMLTFWNRFEILLLLLLFRICTFVTLPVLTYSKCNKCKILTDKKLGVEKTQSRRSGHKQWASSMWSVILHIFPCFKPKGQTLHNIEWNFLSGHKGKMESDLIFKQ